MASGLLPTTAAARPRPAAPQTQASSANGCILRSAHGEIKHVIYIQFDNVHFTRDNPNVPSDLEQMPHLLNFFVNNGTLSTNHHTPLIAHTADDIITALTGVYGERHGQPVSNSLTISTPLVPTDLVRHLQRPSPTGRYRRPDSRSHVQFTHPGRKDAPAPWLFHPRRLQRRRRFHRQHGAGKYRR